MKLETGKSRSEDKPAAHSTTHLRGVCGPCSFLHDSSLAKRYTQQLLTHFTVQFYNVPVQEPKPLWFPPSPAFLLFMWTTPPASLHPTLKMYADRTQGEWATPHWRAVSTVFSCFCSCCRWQFMDMIKFDGMIMYGNHD